MKLLIAIGKHAAAFSIALGSLLTIVSVTVIAYKVTEWLKGYGIGMTEAFSILLLVGALAGLWYLIYDALWSKPCR